MPKVRKVLPALQRRYSAAVREYLARPDERALQRASELGGLALAARAGVLGIASIHHEALEGVLSKQPQDATGGRAIQNAEEFFIESLKPIEMSLRSNREAIAALRHMNRRLEEETERTVHSLHDETGALLDSTRVAIEELGRNLSPQAGERLSKVGDLLRQMEQHLRRLGDRLQPTVLEDRGLLPALEKLARGMAQRASMSIRVEGSTEGRLSPAVERALYRNVREAVKNAIRHGGAATITVEVTRDAQGLLCCVRGDGSGFEPFPPSPVDGRRGLGLVAIRERLDAVAGMLEVKSSPGKGAELLMRIPLGR